MFNIAILGMGVVGGGVYEVLESNSRAISKTLGGDGEPLINVKYVLDRRSFEGHPIADRVTDDFDRIVNDKDVSVVVETMGGAEPAYTFSLRALKAGKSVVTSNKEVVSKFGDVLLKAAKENGVCYLYEASVGGGIPIIAPLLNCLTANRITRIAGILNGTTNYILTEMLTKGASFESALADAQQKGYAERDPSADVEGIDALRKICILGGIAFGRHIPTEQAALCRGITDIKAEDIAAADSLGFAVKLLGVAKDCGGRASLIVAPHLVKKGTLIADTCGVFNAVSVTGNMVDELVFYGRGAGSLPTASAVAADVIAAIRCPTPEAPRERAEDGFCLPLDETPVKLYLRAEGGSSRSLQMVRTLTARLYLQGGADASTVCEVHPLSGGEYAVLTDEKPYAEHKALIEKSGIHVLAEHFVL